jgi:hypothetical protein
MDAAISAEIEQYLDPARFAQFLASSAAAYLASSSKPFAPLDAVATFVCEAAKRNSAATLAADERLSALLHSPGRDALPQSAEHMLLQQRIGQLQQQLTVASVRAALVDVAEMKRVPAAAALPGPVAFSPSLLAAAASGREVPPSPSRFALIHVGATVMLLDRLHTRQIVGRSTTLSAFASS